MNWILLSLAAYAQDTSGFVELRAQGYAGVDGLPLTFVERARPQFSAPLGDRVYLSSTIELNLAQGWSSERALADQVEAAGLTSTFAASGFTFEDDDNEALGVSRAADYLFVDRLYLDLYLSRVDLRVGRQAVRWGSAFLVNPTDPFPEVLLTEPWRPRAGVNAARATLPFGELNQLQLVVGSNDAFTGVRAAARATVNVANIDLSALGAWRQESEDGIVGVDVRGTLGVGYWFEGALHITDEPYEELAVGLDYSFPVLQGLVLTAQYYRNGSGGEASASPALLSDRDDDPFGPVFSGRDYLMGSVSLGATPELSVSTLWIQNLSDGSALAVPGVSLALGGRWQASLTGQLPLTPWGEGGELSPADDALVVDLVDLNGAPQTLDLNPVVPDATLILWTRFNF